MLFKKNQFVSQVYTHRRGTATAVYQEETNTTPKRGWTGANGYFRHLYLTFNELILGVAVG